MDKKRIKAYGALLTTAVIWGIASPVIKYTLSFVRPFTFLFWRFLITSLVFLPALLIYIKKKSIKLNSIRIWRLLGLGFLGTTFTLGLLFVGYRLTTAIDGALIYSVAPIFVVLGGAWFLKEEVTTQEKIGTTIALIGSIVTVIQPILENQTLALANVSGNLLVLTSAIAWAAYCLWVRRLETRRKQDPLILTGIGFFAGLVTIIPFFFYESWTTNNSLLYLDPAALPGILYMSLLSSVVAYFTYNLGYSLIEASEATVFDYLKPVFAAPLAVIWLGEIITLPFLAGAGLIALGVFLTEYRGRKEMR